MLDLPELDPTELERAMEILDPPRAMREGILKTTSEAVQLIRSPVCDADRRRVVDEVEDLLTINSLARSLRALFDRIDPEIRYLIEVRVEAHGLGHGADLPKPLNIDSVLKQVMVQSKSMADALPADRGGSSTLKRTFRTDGYSIFIAKLIGCWIDVKGELTLNSTIPKNPRSGSSCYAFIDAIHWHALGEPMNRVDLYRNIQNRMKQGMRRSQKA